KNGPSFSAGRSPRVTWCSRGITKVCPLNTGRASRKARNSSVASTRWASESPATMRQNGQLVDTVTPPGVTLPCPGCCRHAGIEPTGRGGAEGAGRAGAVPTVPVSVFATVQLVGAAVAGDTVHTDPYDADP